MKKAFVCMVVFALMFIFCTTSFATGSSLTHDGTAKYSYYTSDYVSQKSDPRLKCLSASTTPSVNIMVKPVQDSDDGYVELSNSARIFQKDVNFVFSTYSSVRHIHLKLYNTGSNYGTSVRSVGAWRLYSSSGS